MVIWTWLQSGVCGKIWWNYIPLVNFEATFWLQDGAEEQMTQSWPMRHPPRRREQMIGFSPILKSMFHGLTMDQHVEAMSRQPKAKNWWFALYVCCHVCHIPLVYHLYFLNIWPFGLPSLTPHIFTLVRMISLKPTYYNYTFHYWLMVMQCWIEPSTGFWRLNRPTLFSKTFVGYSRRWCTPQSGCLTASDRIMDFPYFHVFP